MIIDWQRPENYVAAPTSTIFFPWVIVSGRIPQNYEDIVDVLITLTAQILDQQQSIESPTVIVGLDPSAVTLLSAADSPSTVITLDPAIFDRAVFVDYPTASFLILPSTLDILVPLIRGGLSRIEVTDRPDKVLVVDRLGQRVLGRQLVIKRAKTRQSVKGSEEL